MKRIYSRLLLPLLLFSFAIRVVGNEAVTLKNGDRLSGKIVEESDESVTIATEYAGKITIERKHIATIGEPTAATFCQECPGLPAAKHTTFIPLVGTCQLTSPTSVEPPSTG